MTPRQDSLSVLVDDMLRDAGYADDTELRAGLLALGSLASRPVPEPSGDLARLIASGTPGDEVARRRRRSIHRPTALGLALVVGMGSGIGTVAASSPAPGQAGSHTIQEMLRDWSPSWSLPVQAPGPGFLPPTASSEVDGPAVPGRDDGASTPASGQNESGPEEQLARPQRPAAGQPKSAPSLPPQAGKDNGVAAAGRGQGAARLPLTEITLPVAAGAAPPAGDIPNVAAGGVPAAESGLAENLVAPVTEVLEPVTDAPAVGRTVAGLDSWLRKFQR